MKTFEESEIEYILSSSTPGIAKRKGKEIKIRVDWEKVKRKVMLIVVYRKFNSCGILMEKLLNTYPHDLIEGNYWHDNYWGDCRCTKCKNIKGQNNLGKILMLVRKIELKKRQKLCYFD